MRFFLLVLLGTFQGQTGSYSPFNPDSNKPHQWGWEIHKNDFDNAPKIRCPIEDLQRCICKNDVQKSRYMVDCENVFIRSRAYQLKVPHNATHFRATRNDLIMITNGIFRNASRLICLDLSNNWLRTIGHYAFAALRGLTVLDLSHNILFSPSYIPTASVVTSVKKIELCALKGDGDVKTFQLSLTP